jgi:hypothetical protein
MLIPNKGNWQHQLHELNYDKCYLDMLSVIKSIKFRIFVLGTIKTPDPIYIHLRGNSK